MPEVHIVIIWRGKHGLIVYVLINEAMPDYVKLGRTKNLEQRIKQLDVTPIPIPFECFYAARVANANFVERQLHDAFDDCRVRSNREFFRVAPERLVSVLKLVELEDVTPRQDIVDSDEDQRVLDDARRRRSVFNFEMVQISEGAELQFSRDVAVTCRVFNRKQVEFQEKVVSLSKAAQLALAERGTIWKAVQGPLYWEYEGETLSERRLRLESEN